LSKRGNGHIVGEFTDGGPYGGKKGRTPSIAWDNPCGPGESLGFQKSTKEVEQRRLGGKEKICLSTVDANEFFHDQTAVMGNLNQL